ncbi:ATP-binding cassette domain-containing protein [Paraferrimonas haliotis]|uniref:ATP-binding cassette domain-containing protein n=1 Tax=Paraferrimonas haliotis TaxID=2013866 RepID=UPI000BA9643E|nr:ATP-binding cassette domain-containing protein [Paraferrimonas haliotis]
MQLTVHLDQYFGQFRMQLQLCIKLRGIIGVFGTSGAGKTSLFRAIAGLNQSAPNQLSLIKLDGNTLEDSQKKVFVEAEHRNIGFVFQDSRLFNHLTVEQNLSLAIKISQRKEPLISYQDVVQGCGIEPLLTQSAEGLSAGQRQRVAIARALLGSPKLLLLDEPLAALDHDSRQHLVAFLNQVSELIPMLFISHSVSETLTLCDPLILLEGGRIKAIGSREQLAETLPKRRASAVVTEFDPETGKLCLDTIPDLLPEFKPGQRIGIVAEPSWLKSRELTRDD